MCKILGVILAGGLARRMGGGDKCMLSLGGSPVLDRVVARLSPQVAGMALNANGDPSRFQSYDLPVLPDSEPDHPGPLAGVLAGLNWAAEQGASRIVTVAADTPFFPADLVSTLAIAGDGIVLAATPHPKKGLMRHPTFGLWPVALANDLQQALRGGTRKIVAWTDAHAAATASFSADPFDPFFNLNTPEDMLRAEDLIKTGQA